MVAAAALTLALAACTSGGQGDALPPVPTQTAWTPEATSGPGTTTFGAKQTAEQNRGAFDSAVKSVLAKNAQASGNTVAAALKAAGFPMSATQVSASRTSAKLQPGSISIAVRVGSDCLVGQWGRAISGYQSMVAPMLGSGGCLIGGIAPVS